MDIHALWPQVAAALRHSASVLEYTEEKQASAIDNGASHFALNALQDGTGRELTFGEFASSSAVALSPY
jgi:hypothetical protein